MTFLNPALLFGLIAAAIPVIIHLLNLRKLKKIEFSSLMFLKELQRNKIRKIKIKQWIILLLRVLIILFLVFAFARPTIQNISLSGVASSAKTSAVFIFDDTFSMNVINKNGSYFNRFKSVSLSLLDILQEGDDAAILRVSGGDDEAPLLTTNISQLKKEVNELSTSYTHASLNQAIVRAAKLLEESNNFNKEIYILSDMQKTALTDINTKTDLSEVLDERVRVYTFEFPPKSVYNLGIDRFKINTKIFEKDKRLSVSPIITNYSDKQAQNSVVSLFAGDNREAQRSISFEPGESKEVLLEGTIKNYNYNELSIQLESDEMTEDNLAYANIFVPEKLNALILANNPPDAKYVELALSISDTQGGNTIDVRSNAQFNSVDLTRYNVIFLIGPDRSIGKERLVSYLNSGGGLFMSPSNTSTLEDFRDIAQYLNLSYPQTVINAKTGTTASVFDRIDFEHPLFKDLFEEKSDKKLISPEIYKYVKIIPGGTGKSLISLIDNSAFLSEYKYKTGKIFLLSVAPNLEYSNLPLKSIFAPLFYKSLFYLSSVGNADTIYLTGQSIALDPAKFRNKQIRVVKPNNYTDVINLTDGSPVLFNDTDIPGNYKFYDGDKLAEMVSVNIDKKESQTAKLTEGEITGFFNNINFKGKLTSVNAEGDIQKSVKQARFGAELWKLFLALALIAAIIEMILSRSLKKDLVAEVS